MKREHFVKVVEEALDSLPQEFRSRIPNVALRVAAALSNILPETKTLLSPIN